MQSIADAAASPIEPLQNSPNAVRHTSVAPVAAACAVFVALVASALAVSMRHTNGHLVYALDDPYIHMAMAKNFALHGVWGISATHFTSSSSSLVWTAGLAAFFRVFGIHESIPLMVNVAMGIGLLMLMFRVMQSSATRLSNVYVFIALTAVAVAAPLPALVFAGQEHILHAAVNLGFIALAAARLAQIEGPALQGRMRTLYVLAAVLPLIRFESLFAVGIVSAMFAVRHRWKQAGLLIACAALPIVVYGAISSSYGWYWLPNSVLLKGARPDLSSTAGLLRAVGGVSYLRLMELPALAVLLCAAIAAFIFRLANGAHDDAQWMLAIFAALTIVHTQFAQPQAFWFFRYEAYLMVLGGVAVARVVGEWLVSLRGRISGWRLAAGRAGAALRVGVRPLSNRAARALVYIPEATTNIFEQQYQMGSFLRRFHEGDAVALNDIGAASFLGGIECVDLAGLADMDVARRLLSGLYESEEVQELADSKGARIAIVYDSWFGNRIPSSWRRAGTWTIQNNVVLGSNTVTFYALRPEELGLLRTHLNEFAGELPRTVQQRLY